MMNPDARACATSSSVVASVRYSVIKGANREPRGNAAAMRSRYAHAAATVVIGGWRLGMITARPKTLAVEPMTERMSSPSRTCKCQSSGRVIVKAAAFMGNRLWRHDYKDRVL